MARGKWVLLIAVILALAAVVALATSPSAPGTGDIDSDQARDLIDGGIRLVDVRTPAEYSMGHIPGAESVPLSDLASVSAGWDPAQPVLLYCASGDRSLTAMDALVASGFTQVYNLRAGIVSWDGEIVSGVQTAALPTEPPAVSGLPVVYEFYTDW
jgi:rhodanese-related sulfurtransferase